MRHLSFFLSLLALMALVACGGTATDSEPNAVVAEQSNAAQSGSNQAAVGTAETDEIADNQTSDNPADAGQPDANQAQAALAAAFADSDLSPQALLAVGILQLESSGSPISAEQAEAILPYWQALQSIVDSGTAADVEIEAVVKQIQNRLTSEQVAAINNMEISAETIQNALAAGRGAFGGENGGGGFFGGGRPDGGFPGGGPGGGGPGGGGIDPAQLATRQAERFGDGGGNFQDRLLLGSVTRLLETKTGAAPAAGIGTFGIMAIVAEQLGIDINDLRTQMADGQTFTQLIEANGGDLTAIRAAIAAAFADAPLPEGQDIDSFIDDMLNGSFQGRRAE